MLNLLKIKRNTSKSECQTLVVCSCLLLTMSINILIDIIYPSRKKQLIFQLECP